MECSVNHPLRRPTVLLLAVLIVPEFLAAQERRPGAPLAALLQNPVAALLQRADSLGLGLLRDQTARLEELRTDLDEATSSARAALAAVGPQGRRAGGGFRQLRPELERIRAENAAVLELVRAEVLSEAQWEIATAFLESQRPPGRGGGASTGAEIVPPRPCTTTFSGEPAFHHTARL